MQYKFGLNSFVPFQASDLVNELTFRPFPDAVIQSEVSFNLLQTNMAFDFGFFYFFFLTYSGQRFNQCHQYESSENISDGNV